MCRSRRATSTGGTERPHATPLSSWDPHFEPSRILSESLKNVCATEALLSLALFAEDSPRPPSLEVLYPEILVGSTIPATLVCGIRKHNPTSPVETIATLRGRRAEPRLERMCWQASWSPKFVAAPPAPTRSHHRPTRDRIPSPSSGRIAWRSRGACSTVSITPSVLVLLSFVASLTTHISPRGSEMPRNEQTRSTTPRTVLRALRPSYPTADGSPTNAQSVLHSSFDHLAMTSATLR
uniref:Uncharacterized protein n=1 Tax=Mycena chlorophos TaxID=658473 RepID=A0ABQ0LAI3_MYCCL|nr:predicted protein [Mycena chlorophos]